MRFCRTAALSVGMVLLAACTGSEKNPALQGQGQGQLAWLPVETLGGEISADKNDPYGLVFENRLRFKTCLRDTSYLQAVVGKTFTIKGDRETKVTTDAVGCLYWDDSVRYHRLAEETFVVFERTVVSSDSAATTATLRFALNPWIGPKAPVLDLNGGSENPSPWVSSNDRARLETPAVVDEPNHSLRLQNASAWVEEVRPGKGGLSLTLNAEFGLQSARRSIDELERLDRLVQGPFEAEILLVEKKGHEITPLARTERTGVTLDRGIGKLRLTAILTRKPIDTAVLALWVRVFPAMRRSGLSPAGGALDLRASQLVAGTRQSLRQIDADEWQHYATASSNGTTGTATGFEIARFLTLAPGSTQPNYTEDGFETFSTFRFTVRACLVNALERKALTEGLGFEVSIAEATPQGSSQTIKVTTDHTGCLPPLPSSLRLDPFGGKREFKFRMRVTGADSLYVGLAEEVDFSIFPFERDSDKLWDSRHPAAPDHLLKISRPATIALKTFRLEHVGNAIASVSSNLQLTERRNYQFYLNPVFYRPGQPRAGFTDDTANLPDGKYRFRGYALFPLRNSDFDDPLLHTKLNSKISNGHPASESGRCLDIENLGLVCPFWGTVQSRAGQMTAPLPITYDFDQRVALESRGRIYFELLGDGGGLSLETGRIEGLFFGLLSNTERASSNLSIGGDELALNEKGNPTVKLGGSAPTTETAFDVFQKLVPDASAPLKESKEPRPITHHDPMTVYGSFDSDRVSKIGFSSPRAQNDFVDHAFTFYEKERQKFTQTSNMELAMKAWQPTLTDNPYRQEDLFSAARSFCDAFFDKGSREEIECLKQPLSHLALIPIRLLESVTRIVPEDTHELVMESLGAEVTRFKEIGRATSQIEARKGTLRVLLQGDHWIKLKPGRLADFGPEFGVEGYVLEQEEDRQMIRDRARIAMSNRMIHETNQVQLEGEVRRCVWVTARPFQFPSKRGFYFCKDVAKTESVRQRWNYLSWYTGDLRNRFTDSFDRAVYALNQTLRGSVALRRYVRYLEEKMVYAIDQLDFELYKDEKADRWWDDFVDKFRILKFWDRRVYVLGQRDLGESLIGQPDGVLDFPSNTDPALVNYMLAGSIPGLLDDEQAWSGPFLIQHFLDRDRGK